MDEFAKAGLQLLGGIFGAFLGVRLGLRKTKLERAHEKRLDWHREAHGVILDLYEHCRESLMSPGREELAAYEIVDKRFERVVAEARAYMVAEGARGLRLAKTELWQARRHAAKLIRSFSDDVEPMNDALDVADRIISTAEGHVLDGLRRLMPSEPEYPLNVRIKGYFSERWSRLRNRSGGNTRQLPSRTR
ncbi:MAG TPA: hypothetical protein VEY93_04820 [Longimicrobium sp.]|nr:hypothetical protein [Longimicrobium sp.]